MTIRTATVADAADIARIHVDTWRVAYVGIVPDAHLAKLSKADREEKWVSILTKSADGTRVAVSEIGSVIGWASIGPSRDDDGRGTGELYAIYLDHQYWGKGTGRELMQDAVSRLLKQGFETITLWVLEKNIRTRTFYEKAGFLYDGTSKTIQIYGQDLVELRYRMMTRQSAPADADKPRR